MTFALVLALVGAALYVGYLVHWHGVNTSAKMRTIEQSLANVANAERWGGLLCLGAALVVGLLEYF